MSIEKAKACLSALGYADHIIELAASTATVSEAAQALGVQPGIFCRNHRKIDFSTKLSTVVHR